MRTLLYFRLNKYKNQSSLILGQRLLQAIKNIRHSAFHDVKDKTKKRKIRIKMKTKYGFRIHARAYNEVFYSTPSTASKKLFVGGEGENVA